MPEGDSWSAEYRHVELGRLLLDLKDAQSDDDTYLEICRAGGLVADLADRLLSLDRLDEAIAEADLTGNYDHLTEAEIFLQHGCSQHIEPLLSGRIESDRSNRQLDWLKERHKERGELAEALSLAKQKLEGRPSLSGCPVVQELSRELSVWEELRQQLQDRWLTDGNYSLWTEIHLEEGETALALQSVKQKSLPLALGGEQLSGWSGPRQPRIHGRPRKSTRTWRRP